MLTLYALVLLFCPGDCQRIETPFVFKSEKVCLDVGAIEVGRRRVKLSPDQHIDYWIECHRFIPKPELASNDYEYYDVLERTASLR